MGRPRAAEDRKVDQAGYVRVRVDGGWKFEHRVVAEQVLGRPLKRGERVFHLDGDSTNNDPQNLAIGRGPTPTTRLAPGAPSVHADDCVNPLAVCTLDGSCRLREQKRSRDRRYQARRRKRLKKQAAR